MNKEEFLKAIENVPKIDSINPISAYNSINVEDLASAIDRFKKVPTYDELLKENKKYKEVINKAIKKLEQEITFCQNDSQGLYDKCNIAINRDKRILDILKEVE